MHLFGISHKQLAVGYIQLGLLQTGSCSLENSGWVYNLEFIEPSCQRGDAQEKN